MTTSTTFEVSDVRQSSERCPTASGLAAFSQLLNTKKTGAVEACSVGSPQLVSPLGFHGLIETAHVAFAEHYGLELSPDHIWCTIVHGFAKVVNMQPEAFRDKFVKHAERQTIVITRNNFHRGDPSNDWAGCFAEFSGAVKRHIGNDTHANLIADFSTTGPLERTISEIALLDTVQAYFKFETHTMCGIPNVTLLGSPADWQRLAAKVRWLASFSGAHWWLDEVVAIVEQFVAAASGKVNVDFWRSIYKKDEGSGSIEITGWLLKLLPYTKDYKENVVRNPLLGRDTCRPHDPRRYRHWNESEANLEGDETITTRNLPSSLSMVPFVWKYYGDDFDYQFFGGIVGYSQSPNLSLRPQMGWAVRPKPAA